MCLSFHESHRTWLGQRVFRNIELATGSPPVATKLNEACFFVFGPGLDRAEAANILGAHGLPDAVPLYAGSGIEPSTDNWPFLYSSPHGQPLVYYLSLVLLVALAAGLVFAIVRRDRTGATVKMDWHMFLLGAGFLLIETKALAELSLLFGSTWIVNVLVFAGIFVMVLLSVGIVHSGRWRRLDYAYICLGIVLLGWWFFPRDVLNTLSLGGRALVGTGLVVLPIFFAGIVFAGSFAKRSNASVAFGSNLIGAVVGGAVEATSLAWGIRTLTLLALGFYAASWAVMVLQSKRGESESPAV